MQQRGALLQLHETGAKGDSRISKKSFREPLTAPTEYLEKLTLEKFTEKILRVVDETLKEGHTR